MKHKGYLLLYVVILIGFLGVVFLYTMERLQLATLVEGNKLDRLRQEIKMNNEWAEILGRRNEHALEIFRTHAKEFALTDRTHHRTIHTRSQSAYACKILVHKSISRLEWEIRDGSGQPVYATQQVYTILDESAQAGGLALNEKIARITAAMQSEFGDSIRREGVFALHLSADGNRWIVSERVEVLEAPTESEPSTDDEAVEPLLPPRDDTEDPPVSEDEADLRSEDEPESENTEATEKIEEADESEEHDETSESDDVPNDPIWREISDFSVGDPFELVLDGTLTIEADTVKPPILETMICLNGNLHIKGVQLRGIVLHEGEAEISENGGFIYGYYESDRAHNSEKVKYRNNRLHWIRAGMRLPDFIQFYTGSIRRQTPINFQD